MICTACGELTGVWTDEGGVYSDCCSAPVKEHWLDREVYTLIDFERDQILNRADDRVTDRREEDND